jgi:hypothetical protein
MRDRDKWKGGRAPGTPHPRCPDCTVAQTADDGTWLPGTVCDRHAYDPLKSVDADPDGMGGDTWRPWP